MKMKVIYYFIIIQLVCIYGENKPNRPNIVLIIADDLGWNDVGFHGSNQIPTPNIDALAYNGIILHRFYTQPSCTPSRAALLTGQYPTRIGFQGIPIRVGENRYLPLNVKILPEKLKDLGYSTQLIGKWHLGCSFKNVTPTYRGFDYFFGYWYGHINYFNHEASWEDIHGLDMHENFETQWSTQNEYATNLFTRKSLERIEAHNVTQPLFLMLSHLAGHTGLNNTLEVPDIEENDRKFHYIRDQRRRLYAGVIDELDKSVGEVVEALSDKGILEDTIIFFISDNGGQTEGLFCNSGSNWPLRGMKLTTLEGGIRTVSTAYYSKFKNKGVIKEDLFHISDMMPTLYAAAGGNVDDLGKIDGFNQWNSLLKGYKSNRTEILLHIDEATSSAAILGENGRYKLINGSVVLYGHDGFYGDDGCSAANPAYDIEAVLQSPTNRLLGKKLTKEKLLKIRRKTDLGYCRTFYKQTMPCLSNNLCLYDIVKDPCETYNLASKHPKILEKLTKKLQTYWAELKPQLNCPLDSKADPNKYNKSWVTWLEDNV